LLRPSIEGFKELCSKVDAMEGIAEVLPVSEGEKLKEIVGLTVNVGIQEGPLELGEVERNVEGLKVVSIEGLFEGANVGSDDGLVEGSNEGIRDGR
jgi:hypothetical protein